jgi:hypothetical protein
MNFSTDSRIMHLIAIRVNTLLAHATELGLDASNRKQRLATAASVDEMVGSFPGLT